MLFRQCNAPETLKRPMDLLFADCTNEFITIYLDDILVYYKTY